MEKDRTNQTKQNSVWAASMTVEAAFALPFFLFAFLNMISIIEIYRLQSNMGAAMHATAKEMAVYGYEYKEVFGGDAGAAESLGLTYLYAANKVKHTLGSAYLKNAPLSGGAGSINWMYSDVMGEDDCIDLAAVYQVKSPVPIVGFDEFAMYNRIRTRAWTGYDNAKNGEGGQADEEIVYVTPEGEAYHRSRSCTYLKLSIAAIDLGFLEQERNESGGKYYPCEGCGGGASGTVYITNYGNRYHSTLQCSKLKRTILAVPISEAGGRHACGKCG